MVSHRLSPMIRRVLHTSLLILASLVLQALALEKRPTEKLVIHFFGSSTCGECVEIKQTILKPFAREHPDKVVLHLHDTDNPEAFELLDKLEKAYGVTSPSPQELFLPDTVLLGYEAIMSDGPLLLESHLASPETWTVAVLDPDSVGQTTRIKERFEQFTFVGIVMAGLVDG
ncbi:MAG: hypothetical protein GF331_21580, partial [Chitinivibrionales bacterium]|nr:hypothetical protein [Chitinivibrionales bacterium]